MAQRLYDVAVIGAGAVGSAAARQLAKAGARVRVLEQFQLLHERGSSHGESRLYRWCDTHPAQLRMAQLAWQHWKDLERESGQQLLSTVGSLEFGLRSAPAIDKMMQVGSTSGIDIEVLEREQIQDRFPAFSLPADAVGLYEQHGSVINAGTTLRELHRSARQAGAEFTENSTVVGLSQCTRVRSMKVTLADGETVEADKLIVAAGAYATPLLAQLSLDIPLQAWRMSYGYYKVHPSNIDAFQPGKMPVWRSFFKRTYGFPIHEMRGYIKVARHGAAARDRLRSPTEDFQPNLDMVREVGGVAAEHFPAVLQQDFKAPTTCYYTMTNDEQFVLGLVPGYDGRVAISTGCNGAMFKHVPMLGVILSELLLHGNATSMDISPFSPTRQSLWETQAGSGLNFSEAG